MLLKPRNIWQRKCWAPDKRDKLASPHARPRAEGYNLPARGAFCITANCCGGCRFGVGN